MQHAMRMFNISPVRASAVALLPTPWQNLGSAMLGWIHHRAELPAITETAARQRVVRFGSSRMTRGPQHHWGHDIQRRYHAWREATDSEHRRRELGELTQAFAPLIRATVRQYQLSHLAEPSDLQQEAFIGLHEALQSYDPQRGAALAGFVRWRIVGAVLDARRKWIRQSRPWRGNFAPPATTAESARQADTAADSPDVEFEDTFAAITRGLSARDILILRLMILEGKTCRHIGACIGLHHARVSRIYRATLETLRANPRAQQLLTETQ